jgi:UDP:flavonoid glycosyltransferase YjiC (YdhE family)
VARFLFVVPPLAGHVNPTVAVGRELTNRGHTVAWVAHRVVAPLLDEGIELFPVDDDPTGLVTTQTWVRKASLRGIAALEFLWRDFLTPLAVAMVPRVEVAVERFGPDVLVVDQQAFAGAIVARRRGLPWATSATTSAELVDPFIGFPKVASWVRERLVEVQLEAGVDPPAAQRGDLRFSEQLVLAFTTEALAGSPAALPPGVGPIVMVGPSIREASSPLQSPGSDFPWSWMAGEEPLLLVTLGTVNADAGGRFFGVVVETLTDSPWRAVLVAPPEMVGSVPPNVLVQPWVPQLRLLDHVQAVVCHGGHNTVCEALSRGLPLVVAPIRDDQPIVADQVARAGAGVRIRFGRVRAVELREAIAAVLGDPAYHVAASLIGESFAAAGGAVVAADHLEVLAS